MGLTDKLNIGSTRRRALASAWLLAIVLALVAGAAQALGLGQIQVKSQPGEPLLAEIPIEMAVREGGDSGRPVTAQNEGGPAAEAFRAAAKALMA